MTIPGINVPEFCGALDADLQQLRDNEFARLELLNDRITLLLDHVMEIATTA